MQKKNNTKNKAIFNLGYAKGINSRKDVLKTYAIKSYNKFSGENYLDIIHAVSEHEAIKLLLLRRPLQKDEIRIKSINNY